MPARIETEKLIDLYVANNLSAEEIGKIVGVSRRTISRQLHKHNIEKPFSIPVKTIIEMYQSGSTAKDIAKQLNLKTQSIQYYLRINKIKREKVVKKEKQKREYKRHSVNENVFEKFTKESCYWAGFLAADGWVTKKYYKFGIELKGSDQEHLKNFCTFLGRDSDLYFRTRTKDGKQYECVSVVSTSKKIIDDLNDNFCVVNKKSLSLQPPTKIPKDLQRHYIRGYLDGDGWITRNHDGKLSIGICSGSNDLLTWIKDIVLEENLSCMKKVYKSKTNLYSLEYGGAIQTKKILDWIYCESQENTRLERKHERFKKFFYTR